MFIGSLAASAALGDAPQLLPGVVLKAGGQGIVVSSGHATPEVVDWNNDGRQDLIVGQFSQGKVRLYLNTGSQYAPTFSTFSYIKSSGADIITAYG